MLFRTSLCPRLLSLLSVAVYGGASVSMSLFAVFCLVLRN
jgi:hypothetical protein